MNALIYDVNAVRWTFCKTAATWVPSVYWSRWSNLKLREVLVPPLPSGRWVRLKSIMGGICGTDLSALFQRQHPASIMQAFSSFPALLGHENVAEVTEIGPDVHEVEPGQRVVVEPSLSCVPRGIDPVCRSCAEGRFTLCENFHKGEIPPGLMIGWNNFTGGSWSPSFVAHVSQVYPVPDAIPDEVAVLTDPVAGALHGVLRRPPAEGERVLILGGGMLGMGLAKCLKALDFANPVTGLVRHPSQAHHLDVAECLVSGRKEGQGERYARVARVVDGEVYPTRFGHQMLIGGFDLVYDCVGTGQSLTDALKFARAGGTVALVGTSQITLVDTAPIWFQEVDVVGANGRAIEDHEGQHRHTYEIVFDLMSRGRLNLDGWLTHVFAPEDYPKAFETLYHRGRSGALKVAFAPNGVPQTSPRGQRDNEDPSVA